MIHMYKRRRTSTSTCSYYERLWGDPLAECAAHITNIEDKLPNERCSLRENEEVKCEELSKSDLLNNGKSFQSQLSERLDAPTIKFKYTRCSKKLHKGGRSLHHAAAIPLLHEESRSISEMDTTRPNSDRLCCDSCSLDHCQNFTNEKSKRHHHCSNTSANESVCICASILQEPDHKFRDREYGSSFLNRVELGGTKWAAPLKTYCRKSRDSENAHRTYGALMTKRSNFAATDRSFTASPESLEHKAVPETKELGELENVIEHSPSFSQSLGKLTDKVSSDANMICSHGNQNGVRNGFRLFDETNVSMIPSLNDEPVTNQQHEDAVKSYRNICDLSLLTAYEESTTYTAMPNEHDAVLDNLQNHSDDPKKSGAASKDFSGNAASLDCSVQQISLSEKPSELDLNLAAIARCEEAVNIQSELRQQSVEIIRAASLHAKDPKELSAAMSDGTNVLFDINVQPSEVADLVSTRNKINQPVASINESAHTNVLQLFPEDSIRDAPRFSTPKSGLVPAVSFNSSSASVTVALPDMSVSRDFIQDKMVESSCSHARHKLLMDSIRSCNRPQMEATEGFRQNFQPFTRFWCEEELDNLWVGVRRHGMDNWYAMLKDPRLRFSPCRTERDLAEKWKMEQTKLLGNVPGPLQDQSAKAVGIPLSSVPPFMPPGPGFMTRFLTDPMQLSLSNSYTNKKGHGICLPRPPQNFTNIPENGTRLFNRRVRAHRKSQRSESTWGRFIARNQAMPPPQLPTYLASTSSINILPSYTREAPLPPLPVPLSLQHLSNQSQYHDKPVNKGISSSSQNDFLISSTITEVPSVPAFPISQPSDAKPTDPKRRKELINLESEASSEGTISDDDKPTLICK